MPGTYYKIKAGWANKCTHFKYQYCFLRPLTELTLTTRQVVISLVSLDVYGQGSFTLAQFTSLPSAIQALARANGIDPICCQGNYIFGYFWCNFLRQKRTKMRQCKRSFRFQSRVESFG